MLGAAITRVYCNGVRLARLIYRPVYAAEYGPDLYCRGDMLMQRDSWSIFRCSDYRRRSIADRASRLHAQPRRSYSIYPQFRELRSPRALSFQFARVFDRAFSRDIIDAFRAHSKARIHVRIVTMSQQTSETRAPSTPVCRMKRE